MASRPTKTSRRLSALQRPYTLGIKPIDMPDGHYYDNSHAITELMNALSFVFPEGEAFFVRSVKTFASDPRVLANSKLSADIQAFVTQEVQHSA